MLNTSRVKADGGNPDNYYNHYSNNSDSNSLAVNYRVAIIEIAIIVIGVIIVKNARIAINAKLKSETEFRR